MITLYITILCLILAIEFFFILKLAARNSEINTQLQLTESTLKSSIKEIRGLRGIKTYHGHCGSVDATRVVERRGGNTKFWVDDEVVASVPEGSAYSVEQD
jgi:hypothetical protein